MKHSYFILICLIILLFITPGSTWWFDHFDTDTSAHYDGTAPLLSNWKFNAPASMLQEKQNDCSRIYYKDEKLTGGNYTWNYSIGTLADHTYLHFYFGSDTIETNGWPSCNLDTDNTKYFVYIIFGSGTYQLYKNVGGVQTLLDSNPPGWPWLEDTSANFTVTVNWSVETGDILARLSKTTDGTVYELSATDTDITEGYFGFADRYWAGVIRLDYMNAWNLTAVPGPTPTPMPMSVSPDVMNHNITVKKGETWIQWNWSRTENISGIIIDDQDIYLNGTLWKLNYSHNYFNLPNIGSNSYQVLEVWGKNFTYNNVTQGIYSAVRSDPAYVWWYLVLGLGLLCIGYFVPLFGFLAIIILLLGFYMVYQEYTQSYIVLTYALSSIVAMIVTAFRISGGMKK